MYVDTIPDGTTTYVVSVERYGFVRLESKWVGADGTLQGDEIVLSDHAAAAIAGAFRAALDAANNGIVSLFAPGDGIAEL